jgi:hypothetical protein
VGKEALGLQNVFFIKQPSISLPGLCTDSKLNKLKESF